MNHHQHGENMTLKFFRKYLQLINNAENTYKDHRPVLKFYTPLGGCVWLLTELDPKDFRTAFGLCDVGMGAPELGYVDFNELINSGVMLDEDFEGQYPISVYTKAAQACRRITEDDAILNAYMPKNPPQYRPS